MLFYWGPETRTTCDPGYYSVRPPGLFEGVVELSGVRPISKRSGGPFAGRTPSGRKVRAGRERGLWCDPGDHSVRPSRLISGDGGAERNRTAGLLIANE